MKSKEMLFANMNIKHKGLLLSKWRSVNILGSGNESASKTKYLGLFTDDKLTLFSHIVKVMRKIYSIVSGLTFLHFLIRLPRKLFLSSHSSRISFMQCCSLVTVYFEKR